MASYESLYLESIADDTPVYTMLSCYHRIFMENTMLRKSCGVRLFRKAIQSVFATYSNVLISVLHPKAASEW